MTLYRLTLVVLAGLFMMPEHAGAQSSSPSRVTLDVNGGVGYGFGGGYAYGNRRSTSLDGVLAARTLTTPRGALVLGPTSSGGSCIADPCAFSFPDLRSVFALGGWEFAQPGRNQVPLVRVLAGPAYVRANGTRGDALGVHGRIDVGLPVSRHLALVTSLHHTLVPNFQDSLVKRYVTNVQGGSLGASAFSVGLRAQ
jgi:hypothetical protein